MQLPTTTKTGEPIYWGKIKNYKRYRISTDGQVYDTKTMRMMKQNNHNGYMRVQLVSDDGQWKKISVHRLVYQAHVGAIPDGLQINHKDEKKANNWVWNLELMTAKENNNYGTRNERARKAISKQVYQCTLDGKLIEMWESATEASDWGFSQSCISKCCRGKLQTHAGSIWSLIMPNPISA
ncbi:HNH endonuclease signature motif containing protein [Acetobacterium sp.]|uniref:HNH endonuclease signature motif containing protein n=1 Tax=Acetobacterium sp. TaxID=1872094 RepID=UPI002F42BB86